MAKIATALIAPPTWNSRVSADPTKVAELSESLKKDGQLTPIEVEGPGSDGGYILVFGSRRLEAARLAGWTQIEATVRPISSAAERAIRNGIENVKRENLTSFEEARMCAHLRDAGLKNPDISTKMGFSTEKVSNLAITYEKLPTPILAEWEKQNPVATDRFLRELAVESTYPTPEAVMQAWDERVRTLAEEGKTPGKRGKGKGEGGTSGFPVSQSRLNYLIGALSSVPGSPELDPKTRKWAKALLDFVMQGADKPPQGIPPMPVVVKPAPPTEEEKAQRAAEKAAERAAAKAAAAAEKAKAAADAAKAAQVAAKKPQNGKKE